MTSALLENHGSPHVGQLSLHRWHIGELSEDEGKHILSHVNECADCRSKLRTLEAEQQQFRASISFDRFARGVEKKNRQADHLRPSRSWLFTIFGTCAVATTILLLLLPRTFQTNRIKGDLTDATVRIAGLGGQRSTKPNTIEKLSKDERLRIGFRTSTPAFLIVLSIDDQGEITPVYPESGPGLQVFPSQNTQYLPDSLEMTGRGQERLFLFLTANLITVETAHSALDQAFVHSQKNLTELKQVIFPVSFEVQTYTWLFSKP